MILIESLFMTTHMMYKYFLKMLNNKLKYIRKYVKDGEKEAELKRKDLTIYLYIIALFCVWGLEP